MDEERNVMGMIATATEVHELDAVIRAAQERKRILTVQHGLLKRYRIRNRATRESTVMRALSAHEACDKIGWMIGECYVRELG